MKLNGLERVASFIKKNPKARGPLQSWVSITQKAQWRTSMDVKNQFGSASFRGQNRVIFNIHGNDFRLVVKISYEIQVVIIERIGTHAEYDKWEL